MKVKISPAFMTLLLATGCGSAANQSGKTDAANSQSAASAGGAAAGSGAALALDVTSSAPVAGASQVQVLVVNSDCSTSASSTAGSSSESSQAPGGRHHHGKGQHHRAHGIAPQNMPKWMQILAAQPGSPLANLLATSASSESTAPVAGAPAVTPAAPTAAPTSTSTATAPSDTCIVQNLKQNFQAGAQLAVPSIPVGQYDVTVALEDSSGNPLEQGSASVQVISGQAATASITLTPVTPPATGSIDITISQAPGAAAKLAFIGSPLSQVINDCGAIQIEAVDANAIAVPLVSALSLNISSSSSSGSFFSDAACTVAATTVSIAAGSSSGMVYYKDSVAGSPTLSATDPSSSGLGSISEAVTITAQ